MQPFGNGVAPSFVVEVLNDATLGIASALIDVGNDGLDIAERIGKTAATRGIQSMPDHDGDWLTLHIR